MKQTWCTSWFFLSFVICRQTSGEGF